jgi:hypothetical protein
MRFPALAAVISATMSLVVTGCGYIGDPLPPALRRPLGVTDLAAVQRGSNLIITFTIPQTTTEGLPLHGDEQAELRVGPPAADVNAWARGADREPIKATGDTAHVEVPASKWYNQTVNIAVNVSGPTGHSLGWSPYVSVMVVPALPKPEGISAENAPDAVHLTWHAGAPEFRIFRKLPDETGIGMQIGTSNKPEYTDKTIEYGKTYDYTVQSVEKTATGYAESELSDTNSFRPKDTFPPAVPTGLTAVPGSRTIDLVWDRNTEKDFASYRIFRDGQQIAEGITAPAFSDRDVKPGTKYRYQVSALDNAGNESARSVPAEAVIP